MLRKSLLPPVTGPLVSDKPQTHKAWDLLTLGAVRARDARRFLEQHQGRVDHAIDAFYNEPVRARREPAGPSTSKLNQLFDHYKGENALSPMCSASS